MNQKFGFKLLTIVTLISALLAGSATAADETRYLRIAAGDVASGLFELAGVLASAISNPQEARACRQNAQNRQNECLTLIAVAQTSASAQAALTKLRSGAADLAVVPDSIAYAAYTGASARRTSAWPQLRTLANLTVRPLLFFVRGEREANSIASLQRLRIAVGPRSSDISDNIVILLAALGLPPGAYTPVSTNANSSAYDLLRTNQADVAIMLTSELPAPERAALASGELRLVSPSKGELERVAAAYPFVSRRTLEAGTGLSYTTIGTGSVLVARADLAAPVVQALLQRLWIKPGQGPGLSRMAGGIAAQLDARQAAYNLPAPLHASAAAFYQDNKLLETR